MKLENKHKGILLALIGVLFITPDSLSIRLISINSWDLMFYRGLIPFICLLVLLLFVYKKNFIKICLAIGYAGILNAILVALGNITFVASLENTNVANTLIMISLAPFMAAIFSSIFLKEYPNRRTWITMLICFFFVIYIFYDSYESNKLLGDILGLTTAVIIGASSVVIRYGKFRNFLPSLMLGKLFTMVFTIFFVTSLALEGTDILLILIIVSFSITFYLMLPNNNLVKNPLQLQYFLLADVFFVILLLALIIRQLILIIIYRRNKKDESKLYIKFVNLFAAMAVGPTIGLVVITSLFFNLEFRTWYGGAVRDVVVNSNIVARDYENEIQAEIISDTQLIIREIVKVFNDVKRGLTKSKEMQLGIQGFNTEPLVVKFSLKGFVKASSLLVGVKNEDI